MFHLRFIVSILFAITCFSSLSWAQFNGYKPGEGSKFKLEVGGQNVEVLITIASQSKSQINVEMLFKQQGLMNMGQPMWQQFEISRGSSGALEVNKGYVFFNKLQSPEILTPDYLNGFSGVQMNSFLFADAKHYKGQYLGMQTIKTKAGPTKARHFKHTDNGQTIEYWISDEAKPIGLVKLVSTGSKRDHNYKMELASLVKNVKPKINPKKAKPLSKLARETLPDPKLVQLLKQ